jgi:hypothetical protein
MEKIMVPKHKVEITFAVFQRVELSPLEIANTMVNFEAWEQDNLGVAETTEGRLTVWDDTLNGGRLAQVSQEENNVASSRFRTGLVRS